VPGRKQKSGARYAGGKLRPQTDHGSAYAAMQRLARSSPDAAADVLAIINEAADLEFLSLFGRPIWNGDRKRFELEPISKEERARLRFCQDYLDRLPRMGRDKRLSYPLGVMFARGEVTSRQHYVGRRYAAQFVAGVRPLTVPSILADLVGRGALQGYRPDQSGTSRPQLEIDYRSAREALGGAGLRCVRVVDQIVVYEEGSAITGTPKFRLLSDGLAALDAHYERVDEMRRALDDARERGTS